MPVFTPASRIRFWFNALLYNSITDAWKYILGENFHWGYFSSPDVPLAEATDALIDQMAALGNLSDQTKILDVGCGVGNPAFYLHQKYGCDITGISISDKGVYQAEEESQKRGYHEKVRFRVANALDNGFADNTFDVAWVMESSHLMKDKKKLFAECYRVLKPGGLILLCDIMLRRSTTPADLLAYLQRLKLGYFTDSVSFVRAFGMVRMETFKFYQDTARGAGFDDVKFVDVSEQVVPTIDCWRANIAANKQRILETISPSQLKCFLEAIDLSTAAFEIKLGGYGIIKASKH